MVLSFFPLYPGWRYILVKIRTHVSVSDSHPARQIRTVQGVCGNGFRGELSPTIERMIGYYAAYHGLLPQSITPFQH
jgi:hypothetical protein